MNVILIGMIIGLTIIGFLVWDSINTHNDFKEYCKEQGWNDSVESMNQGNCIKWVKHESGIGEIKIVSGIITYEDIRGS